MEKIDLNMAHRKRFLIALTENATDRRHNTTWGNVESASKKMILALSDRVQIKAHRGH